MDTTKEFYEKIKEVRLNTGCSIAIAKKAILYTETHNNCTAIGFVKAVSLAVATPSLSFEERVKMFSKKEK